MEPPNGAKYEPSISPHKWKAQGAGNTLARRGCGFLLSFSSVGDIWGSCLASFLVPFVGPIFDTILGALSGVHFGTIC